MSVFVWNIFYHYCCASIKTDVLKINCKPFTLLYCDRLSISHWFFLRSIQILPIIEITSLWRSRRKWLGCHTISWKRNSIWCVISLFCNNSYTILQKLVLSLVFMVWFFLISILLLASWRIRFPSSWIINIYINVVILHNNNLLVEVACPRNCSTSLNWLLTTIFRKIKWFWLTQPFYRIFAWFALAFIQ